MVYNGMRSHYLHDSRIANKFTFINEIQVFIHVFIPANIIVHKIVMFKTYISTAPTERFCTLSCFDFSLCFHIENFLP